MEFFYVKLMELWYIKRATLAQVNSFTVKEYHSSNMIP